MKGGGLRFDRKTGMWDPGNVSGDAEVYQYSENEADALNLLKVPDVRNPIAFLMQKNEFDLRGVNPEPLGDALDKLCKAYALRFGVDTRKGDGGHDHYRERLGNLINMIILNTSDHRKTSNFKKAMSNFERITTNEVAPYKRAAAAAEAETRTAEQTRQNRQEVQEADKREAIDILKKKIGIDVIEEAYENAIAHKIAENTGRIHRKVQIVYFEEIVQFLPKKWEKQLDWWVLDVLLNQTKLRDRPSVTMSDIRGNSIGGSRTRRRRRIRKSRRIK